MGCGRPLRPHRGGQASAPGWDEGEPALRPVKLHGGHAQIEQNRIHACPAQRGGFFRHLEFAVGHRDLCATRRKLHTSALPEAARTYRVQFKNDLRAPAWTDLPGDIPAASPAASRTDSSLGTNSQRFYRVVTLP